uniref:Uncharacterized protein n=1 Tax=Tanacetum cinerariifolium TaxID=118510 RepID=A0A6L2K2J7_TANCI|nr:hypothetical protein [Tanacetum cinerariifolium]
MAHEHVVKTNPKISPLCVEGGSCHGGPHVEGTHCGHYMKTFRKSICVKIKEEVEFIEGEVEFALTLQISEKCEAIGKRIQIFLKTSVYKTVLRCIDVLKLEFEGSGEKKTVKKPCQTSRGVLVDPKKGFKPQKEYRPVPKKPNASSSGNNKKGVEPTIKVSNSNLFDVLNSVDNDGEFGTNEGNTNLVNNKATSKRKIGKGKLRLLDNEGNPLVPTGIVESDSEVEVVFNEIANLRISTSGKDGSDKGYGTNS